MPFLEDSGIESEDKSSLLAEEQVYVTYLSFLLLFTKVYDSQNFSLGNDTAEHMEDLEVTFRGPSSITNDLTRPSTFPATNTSPLHLSSDPEDSIKPLNTCRILQRKLELKVERAKRNYTQYQESNVSITG